jgi:hypothetical protein
MVDNVNNPKDLRPTKQSRDDLLIEAVGLWNNRWPEEVESVESTQAPKYHVESQPKEY